MVIRLPYNPVMPCHHPRIASEVKITQVDGKRWAEVRLICGTCRDPFRFVGIRPGTNADWPTTSPDAELARLPIEMASGAPQRIKCAACGRLLFGRSRDGAELHRAVKIDEIECGPIHVVRFADGVAVRVADGKIWSEDDGEE